MRKTLVGLGLAAVLGWAGWVGAAEGGGEAWPGAVAGFVAPGGGEHPRLLFRKSELAAIKARAQTPEGKAIVGRLKFLLDGKEGDTFPSVFNTNPAVNTGAKGPGQLPIGAFTMGHGAGYGMLYQLTGEKKYAELSKQSLEKMFSGTSDRDERYTWTSPGAGLRTGMMMTCVALAYDLSYDGWDDAFRKKVVDEIQNYKHVCVNSGGYEGGKAGLDFAHIVNPYYPPGSNHYGALVGGAATAILAIKGDPGADDKQLGKLQQDVEKNIVRVLTQGFGDHGMFAEGPGPSHMAANTSLVTALQTMKVAGGRDFISPRSNGQWLTLRWAFETVLGTDGKAYYPCRNPSSYGTELFAAAGTSDGGEFCQGFGAIPEAMRPGLLWTFNKCVEPGQAKEYADRLPKGEKSYDALTYPHRAVLSLVNWPIEVEAKDPGALLGHSYHDTIHGYVAFRNQWKDADDCIVTAYLKSGPGGYIKNNDVGIKVWALGMRLTLPAITGKVAAYEARADGSGTFSNEAGSSAAVDYSGKSGAPCVVVVSGPNVKGKDGESKSKDGAASARTTVLTVGGKGVVVMTVQKGAGPEVKGEGERISVGKQTFVMKDGVVGMEK